MNILFVVPYVPNLVRVRPYNLIRSLTARGHQLTVATLWTNEHELPALEELRRVCKAVIAARLPAWRSLVNAALALPTRRPLQASYSWDAGLAKQLAGLVSGVDGQPGFDVVHVEHLRGSRYGLYVQAACSHRETAVPVVWDSVDSISLLFRQAMVRARSPFSRAVTRLELGRTELYEGWLLNQFARVLVTSPADCRALLALAKGITPPSGAPSQVQVLPNGVDLTYFTPGEDQARATDTLVVSGKMSYHANVTMVLHLVEDIMPRVWSERQDVNVVIVGKDPPKEIQDLAQNPRVRVTGTVADLRPYLKAATLAVAPLAYGVGIQNKVLEAMACATPVVATPQAISALSVQPGVEALVAQEPADFAGAILKLFADPQLRARVGLAGRRYVETHHDWAVIGGQLEQVYAGVRIGK